jgi:oxygen-independent coproporphyrinogen III oxidase
MVNARMATHEITKATDFKSRAEVLGAAFAASPLGLYLHVPFCSSTCDFCAFYQTTPTREGVAAYLAAVRQELALVAWRKAVDTVFWGGGTPGLLSPADLSTVGGHILSAIHEKPSEWTVELAPASVTAERLAALKEIGVDRISLGVQSFSPALLDALGRQHTREQVFRAYDRVRAADFRSVNLDLMFALPGQDELAWHSDLATAVALAPDHISTYCLTFEEDTKLWVKLSKGQVKLDLAHEARLYEQTWDELAAAGYAQYEVSNFARPDHRCQHNLNTWRMHEWVGIGPSAAGQHDGWRGANPADLARWMAEVASGERMSADRVALSPALLAEDAVVFGLRLNCGVDLTALQARFAAVAGWTEIEATITRLAQEGFIERGLLTPAHICLTPKGRLLADAIGAELMGILTSAQQ